MARFPAGDTLVVMQRREFLVVCVGGVAFACVPAPGKEHRGSMPAASGAPDAGVAAMDAALAPDAHEDATAHDPEDAAEAPDSALPDAEEQIAADASEPADAGECQTFVMMHDTNAQALYFDGTYGPLTGVVTVDYVRANVDVDLEFWH